MTATMNSSLVMLLLALTHVNRDRNYPVHCGLWPNYVHQMWSPPLPLGSDTSQFVFCDGKHWIGQVPSSCAASECDTWATRLENQLADTIMEVVVLQIAMDM